MRAKLKTSKMILTSVLTVLFVISIIPVLAGESAEVDLTATVTSYRAEVELTATVTSYRAEVDLTATVTAVSGPPVAEAGGPYSGKPGESITFDGSGSYDDGTIVSYAWTFGDGGTGTGASPSHTYTADGTYPVILTVTDDDGLPDTDDTTAKISTPTKPPPSPPPYIPPINKPPVAEAGPNRTVYVDEVIQFSGAGSYDPDGTILFYDWDFDDGTTASGMNVSHVYSEPGIYTANLTVMDDRITDGSDTCTITVKEHVIPVPPLPPFLDNLTVTPAELELGDNVTISVDIMNLDSQSITYAVDMHIENVNDPPPTWPPYDVTMTTWVDLEAYEFKTVFFTITMDTVGDFNVTVHGMTGSFKVGTWPPPTPPRPAEFELSNMIITPEEFELGEGLDIYTFKVTVDVTNVGEQEGTHTVDLLIDGFDFDFRIATLGGGLKTSITFDVTIGVGSYTVEVDGLTGSFVLKPYLIPLRSAEFVLSGLEVTPEEVEEGLKVTVAFEVSNMGEVEGSYTVELKVDGYVVDSKEVILEGGASVTVLFELTRDEGTYQVEVEGMTDSFTVVTTKPPFWMRPETIALIIIVIIAAAAILYAYWKGLLPLPRDKR